MDRDLEKEVRESHRVGWDLEEKAEENLGLGVMEWC